MRLAACAALRHGAGRRRLLLPLVWLEELFYYANQFQAILGFQYHALIVLRM